VSIELLMCQRTHPAYLSFRERHYIPNNGCHGQQLHYLVLYEGKQIGVISGASAVYGVKARDLFFGIEHEKRKVQLNSIINNVVYRVENAPRNVPSQALAMWRKRIAADWEYLYQVKVAGFETFVIEAELDDGRTRSGALYRADNWQMLGLTAGSTKSHAAKDGAGGMNAAHTRKQVCRKLILARRVKGVKLCESYTATWRDPQAQKAVQARRKELLARDKQLNATLELSLY
jgi:hypothetical protein|tara:strand:+ start:160 stop:855 length:696 start_codon:yes stop_codon:yes gene_type:complete